MARKGNLVLLILFMLFSCASSKAQMFRPGKLVQIGKPHEYPFDLLELKSIVGQEYILMGFGATISLNVLSDSQVQTEQRLLQIDANKNKLKKLFAKQGHLDGILAPLLGKQFQIVSYEYDTGFMGLGHLLYIDAQFQNGPNIVFPVAYGSLLGSTSSLLPVSVLDSARKRWVGRHLWVNALSNDPPAFTKVEVLSIEPNVGPGEPYAFRVRYNGNDTATIHCALQPEDTTTFASGHSPFSTRFLEQDPRQYWRTVADTGLANAGIALGEDSATFLRTIHRLGIRIGTYQAAYLPSGHESSILLGLFGSGLWGAPVDSAFATFRSGKLNSLTFMIMDSESLDSTQSFLFNRFGEPTMNTPLLEHAKVLQWIYYPSSSGTIFFMLWPKMLHPWITHSPRHNLFQLPWGMLGISMDGDEMKH